MQSWGRCQSAASAIAMTALIVGCGSGAPSRGGSSTGSEPTAAEAASSPDGPGSDHSTTAQRKADYLNPPGQPPLGRPLDATEERVLSIDDPMQRAREALRVHKLTIAENIVYGPSAGEHNAPEWRQIKEDVAAAEQADINPIVATEFPAKVRDTWLPQIAELSSSDPTTIDQVQERVQFFDVMAANLDGDRQLGADGRPLPDAPAAAAARAKLHLALEHKQAQAFPGLRRAYIKLVARVS